MNFRANPLNIEGCYSASLSSFEDLRGNFQKLYQSKKFQSFLPNFEPKEIYMTSSSKNVLRGMHFQIPPDDHEKIVICLNGKFQDVLLDLREGKNFGKSTYQILSPNNTNMMIIPKGIAHGFYSFEANTKLLYLVGSEYNQEKDTGIKWNSFNFDWHNSSPILSNRDIKHQNFSDFSIPEQWRINYVNKSE